MLKYYKTPFHVTEPPEVAGQSVLKADLLILIRDIAEIDGDLSELAQAYIKAILNKNA